ncbi:MAG: GlsB/YeaQ/YmgE family stress response membrane protein [Formivibrio sp.]|nr:GlsB/YeaQ/YmgE family stress response membrane protein [Formivibrio sp.]
MSLLAWIVLGLIAGFIANKIVKGKGQGVVLDMVLGIVGAVFGGWIFKMLGMRGVAGFSLYSLLVAVVGAVLLLVVYHAISGNDR